MCLIIVNCITISECATETTPTKKQCFEIKKKKRQWQCQHKEQQEFHQINLFTYTPLTTMQLISLE